MSDTEEMLAGGIGGAAVRAGACRGRSIRRNLKAKFTCFSPVLSGGRIGAPQPRREIGQFEAPVLAPPSRYAALPPPCPRGRVGVGAGIGASTSGDRALAAASAGHFSPLTKFLTSGGFSAGPNKPASVLKYTTISVFSSFTAAGANLSIIPPSAKA